MPGYQCKESDWKKYRDLVEPWRERYLTRKNAEIAAFLKDEEKTATERFWDAQEILKKEGKILVKCFDPHSRSTMQLSLLLMLRYEIVEDSDLEVFSDELREWIEEMKAMRDKWNSEST